jgi:hypothetical protein
VSLTQAACQKRLVAGWLVGWLFWRLSLSFLTGTKKERKKEKKKKTFIEKYYGQEPTRKQA